MRFNNHFTRYIEELNDLESLAIAKKQGIHPIQMLIDYGYKIGPNQTVIDPDGNIYQDVPELYDLIQQHLER